MTTWRMAVVLTGMLACTGAAWPSQPGLPTTRIDPPAAKQDEEIISWAREIAEDFLRAILGGRADTAKMLLTTEVRQSSTPNLGLIAPMDGKVMFRMVDGKMMRVTSAPVPASELFREFTIGTSRLATERDEVVFRGTLKGEGAGTFTLRVVKEKDSGKWRVCFFDAVVTEPPKKKDPPPEPK